MKGLQRRGRTKKNEKQLRELRFFSGKEIGYVVEEDIVLIKIKKNSFDTIFEKKIFFRLLIKI